jgi:hypothetical protein
MMTLRHAARPVLSYYNALHGQQCDAILSGHLTVVAMTKGGQQPMVVGGCTEAADWHITPAIPATTAFKRPV